MSDPITNGPQQQAESTRAEQLRRRLADVVLIRHRATELSDQWHELVPNWAYTGQGEPDDLLPWNKPANQFSNIVDELLRTEAVVCTRILDLEAGATTTGADDGDHETGQEGVCHE